MDSKKHGLELRSEIERFLGVVRKKRNLCAFRQFTFVDDLSVHYFARRYSHVARYSTPPDAALPVSNSRRTMGSVARTVRLHARRGGVPTPATGGSAKIAVVEIARFYTRYFSRSVFR
jgi:hypothetical protein